MESLPTLEINQKRIEYTGLYSLEESLGGIQMGSVYQKHIFTTLNSPILQVKPFGKPLWFVNYFRETPDGGFYGFKGMFQNGVWDTDENDHPLLRVWT